MWISAATPGGSGGTELWISTNVCDHTQAIVSIRDPSRLVVTCNIHGHILDLCVLHAPSAHPPPRAEEWWESTGALLRRIFRPARDRIIMIDANGRLGAAPTPLLGQTCRPDFDDNGYSLLEFMHHWDMEAPATFEPLHGIQTLSSGTQSSHVSHSHFRARRTIGLWPPRLPFSPSLPSLLRQPPSTREMLSEILRQSREYSNFTTGYRPSLQATMPPMLSISFPSWHAFSWQASLPVLPPGRVDPGLPSKPGRYFNSCLRPDGRVLP